MKQGDDLHQLLQGKRLLIFDFDGTVADTSPLHAAAFAQVLAPLGIAVDYPALAGLKTLDAMRKCLAATGREMPVEEIDTLVEAKQRLVRQMIAKHLVAVAGSGRVPAVGRDTLSIEHGDFRLARHRATRFETTRV